MAYNRIFLAGHGGGCCGVRHIFRMGQGDAQWQERLLEVKHAVDGHQSSDEGKVLEIIMTDHQIETSPNLTAGLKELGFQLKTRFLNSSGGMCNVLHHSPHNKLHGSPYWKKDK